jgi:hypothetical protein
MSGLFAAHEGGGSYEKYDADHVISRDEAILKEHAVGESQPKANPEFEAIGRENEGSSDDCADKVGYLHPLGVPGETGDAPIDEVPKRRVALVAGVVKKGGDGWTDAGDQPNFGFVTPEGMLHGSEQKQKSEEKKRSDEVRNSALRGAIVHRLLYHRGRLD